MKITVISGVYKTVYQNSSYYYCYLERDNDKALKFHFFL